MNLIAPILLNLLFMLFYTSLNLTKGKVLNLYLYNQLCMSTVMQDLNFFTLLLKNYTSGYQIDINSIFYACWIILVRCFLCLSLATCITNIDVIYFYTNSILLSFCLLVHFSFTIFNNNVDAITYYNINNYLPYLCIKCDFSCQIFSCIKCDSNCQIPTVFEFIIYNYDGNNFMPLSYNDCKFKQTKLIDLPKIYFYYIVHFICFYIIMPLYKQHKYFLTHSIFYGG